MSNIEIEKKFLVLDNFPKHNKPKEIIQSYIFIENHKELRIRITDEKICTLDLKFNKCKNFKKRLEFSYGIPVHEGQEIINQDTTYLPIVKERYIIPYKNHVWEVDVFKCKNEGLIIGEIELENINETFEKPPWALQEVTGDEKYYNFSLFIYPYQKWRNK